jgi:hypothetical protein
MEGEREVKRETEREEKSIQVNIYKGDLYILAPRPPQFPIL